jgi:MFS family permease
VLVAGWVAGLPVPVLILLAPDWSWVVAANILLGVNQGLCWSTAVIMKIDLAGPERRGLAMGLNEAAGYLAVSVAAFSSGYLAAGLGLRFTPFFLGIIFAVAGLLLSLFAVRESLGHARHEAALHSAGWTGTPQRPGFFEVLRITSWKNRSLFAVSQAGLVKNLNDGMAWGLLPLYFAARGLSLAEVSILGAIYPAIWGLGQLVTGGLSDRVGRKPLIVAGMWLQGAAILLFVVATGFKPWLAAAVLLGAGTAMVYPTLLAAIGDVAHPEWRATAVGVYRLWRDSGYAVGALLAGFVADAFGTQWAISAVGGLTIASGIVVALVMYETLPARRRGSGGPPASVHTSG